MKNKLIDLNNHLFAQMERLGEESLKGEALQNEVARSKAITDIAGKLIDNAKVAVDAEKLKAEYGRADFSTPAMIEHIDGSH